MKTLSIIEVTLIAIFLIISREAWAYIIMGSVFSFVMGAVLFWFKSFVKQELKVTNIFILKHVK